MVMARKFTMSIPNSMYTALEKEMRERKLDTIQETIRALLSDYFKKQR